MDMLTISHLKKQFGSKKVIDDLSFSIPEHSIFGFVGQNGAGKTTTMKMILGLLPIDSGEILVGGQKVTYGNTTTNKLIGYLPDVPEFYNYMTPAEYLTFCGEITGLDKKVTKSRVEELLVQVGLEKEHKRIKGFSRGMKQRLGIAQALMGQPKLLICDEPTSALDPLGRKELLDILVSAKKDTTVMFSTHILSDVERICDRMAFLHEGKLALSGTREDIHKLRRTTGYEIMVQNRESMALLEQQFAKTSRKDDYTLIVEQDGEKAFQEIMEYLIAQQIAVDKIEKCESSLESLFMEVVAR